MTGLQAEEEAPIKPGQALRDSRGRVNMDDLTDAELDYGCDEQGLASLRARLKKAINSYNGGVSASSGGLFVIVAAGY